MNSTQEACKQRINRLTNKGKLRKLGRIRAVVFYPNAPKIVGYIVKRPDLLWMFKRKDVFVAADCVSPVEGGRGLQVRLGSDAYDSAACKRLGVDYDECVIWDGMPVRTQDGRELGTIANVYFDEETLLVERIDLSTGGVARALLGETDIMREQILGFKGDAILVSASVGELEASGGAAAAAGEAWAKTKHAASEKLEEGKQAASEGAQKAGEAVDAGAEKAGHAVGTARRKMNDAVDAHELKKQREQETGELTGVDKAASSLGKQLGRASNMFRDFKSEYDKASRKS